jgi:hypothetical protein
LRNVKVSARIAEVRGKITERVIEFSVKTMTDVVAELTKIAFADMGDFFRT